MDSAQDKEQRAEARETYLRTLTEYERVSALADAAFYRWFTGETSNGAAASRLANRVSYLSADLYSAEGALWALDIDPESVR